MKATKTWHCSCCDSPINPGDDFVIIEGSFFIPGHPLKPEHEHKNIVKHKNTTHKNIVEAEQLVLF